MQNLNLLETNSLVKMDDGFILQPTGMDLYSLANNGYIFMQIFRDWSADGSLLCGIREHEAIPGSKGQ